MRADAALLARGVRGGVCLATVALWTLASALGGRVDLRSVRAGHIDAGCLAADVAGCTCEVSAGA